MLSIIMNYDIYTVMIVYSSKLLSIKFK